VPSRTARFARYADERNVGCVYRRKVLFNQETNHIVEVVTDSFFLEGVLYIKLRKVCNTQTRGTWDGCMTERCSSIQRQTIYIGPVEVITDPFFLEGVLYIKLTSHVSISVFTRIPSRRIQILSPPLFLFV